MDTLKYSRRLFGIIPFPFTNVELKRLVPMFFMLFLICFNYSVLRNLKDSIVITAGSAGAEVIPFIKVWAVLPMAVLFTLAFVKLSNRYSQERVFYIITTFFIASYALFAFVLYPMREALHDIPFLRGVEEVLPSGFKGFISMFHYWSFTGFYVLSELWGSMVMNILFWGLANEVTKISEARTFYSMLGIGSNLAAILAGQIGVYFSYAVFNPKLPFGESAWDQSLMILVGIVVASGILTMVIFRWLNVFVLNDEKYNAVHTATKPLKIKQRLSIRKSFTYLLESKYLACIAILVLGYNLTMNLVEVVWKDQLTLLYPTPADVNRYLNNITTTVGVFSTVLAIALPFIMKRWGWTRTALITPVMMLVTSIGFFGFIMFGSSLEGLSNVFFATSPLAIAVFFGAVQNSLSKAAKYSVFDATKEMTFIPLDHDVKLKGKAAIDGIGSRLGKSGSSMILQALLMIFTTFATAAPIITAILVVAIILWMVAVRSLGRQFATLAVREEGPSEEVVDLIGDHEPLHKNNLQPALKEV